MYSTFSDKLRTVNHSIKVCPKIYALKFKNPNYMEAGFRFVKELHHNTCLSLCSAKLDSQIIDSGQFKFFASHHVTSQLGNQLMQLMAWCGNWPDL